jgi:hypothetical protein
MWIMHVGTGFGCPVNITCMCLGCCLQAYECVPQEAVQQLVHVVTHMLAGCHPDVLQRMVEAGCNIAIIGRHQVKRLLVDAVRCSHRGEWQDDGWRDSSAPQPPRVNVHAGAMTCSAAYKNPTT